MNLAPTNWRVRAVQEHLEQVIAERDALRADNERLTHRVNMLHGDRGSALRRARWAEAVVDSLRVENDALRARGCDLGISQSASSQVADASRSALPRFLELARIERYVLALYDTEIEVDARLANRALAYVADLVAELERQRPGLKDRRRTA